MIKVNNIISGLRNIQDLDTTTLDNDLKYSRTKLLGGELIISVVGTIGKTAIVPNSFAGCNLVRATAMIDIQNPLTALWVKYYIDSPLGQNYIKENLNTTVQPTLNVKSLVEMPIPFYSQHVIKNSVAILKALDDKIECNRRINENLEQQAQALFKSWFVDYDPFRDGEFVESELGLIPKGWSVSSIGDMPIVVTDYVANGSFASLKENVKLYQNPEYAYFLRNTDLKSGAFIVFVDKHSYDFLSKSQLNGGEIIISNVGDVGSVFICPKLDKPMTLGNNMIMLKCISETMNAFLYVLFKWSYGQELIQSIKGGSAQPKFNKTDFKALRIVLPSHEVINEYGSILVSIFKKVEEFNKECRKLAQLRDTLLPKLMSGELQVDDVKL